MVNQGQWQPLQLLKNPVATQGARLLSAESSYMVSDMLRQNIRPDIYNKSIKTKLPLYWKTGTSNGLRDAWTVGYFGNYTLVVWFGHFNNKSNPQFIGRRLANAVIFTTGRRHYCAISEHERPIKTRRIKFNGCVGLCRRW